MSKINRFLLRSGGLVTGTGVGIYGYDRYFNDSTIGRSVRTVKTASQIIWDYKWNFPRARGKEEVEECHRRTAERILECCQLNGGLYIKFGQQIAQQAAILPPQYTEVLKVMYDKAPVVSYDQVEKIFQEEFGQSPGELFKSFEPQAFASASIAQVHKAELWDGTKVAVKVQKPYIKKQLDYDLMIYRFLCYSFEKAFDLPLYWATEYTEKHLRQEVDFEREGHNAETCHQHIREEPALAPYLYVPKVYWERTSSRILTAEWIDGISLTDPEILTRQGHSLTHIMAKMVDLFSHQIFVTGFVHCDPHPGNILIRPNPRTDRTQVVILDHGLYIREDENFRHQYSLFWKSLFMMDLDMVKTVASQWGIGDSELFASATLLRPYRSPVAPHLSHKRPNWNSPDDLFSDQVALKERAMKVLGDTQALPRELIFVGRNMNIVRANNKLLGSPVNRIGIMAEWAVQGLSSDWSNWGPQPNHSVTILPTTPHQIDRSLSTQFLFYCHYLQFKTTLLAFSLGFYAHHVYQTLRSWFYGLPQTKGFEETLDEGMVGQVKAQMGIDLNQLADS